MSALFQQRRTSIIDFDRELSTSSAPTSRRQSRQQSTAEQGQRQLSVRQKALLKIREASREEDDAEQEKKSKSKSKSLESTLESLGKEEGQESTFLQKAKAIYDCLGIKHFIPVILLIVYTILGALIFVHLEHDAETAHNNKRNLALDSLRTSVLHNIDSVYQNNLMTADSKLAYTKDVLAWFEKELGVQTERQAEVMWDTWNAIFYCWTVYTTIGYGNIYPRTRGGQALTMVYAIFGIPIVLCILNDWGDLLCRFVNYAWDRFTRHSRYLRRTFMRNLRKTSTRRGSIWISTTSPSSSIPAHLAIGITVVWMLVCSAIFLLWESWTYFESFYFFFISLSTIGLGDIAPAKPAYMIGCFWLVLIGLSLLSMCFHVIQVKIEEFMMHMMFSFRAEYERILEANGDITDEEKQEMIKNLWKKQPWYTRAVMQTVMGERQKETLQKQCEQIAQISENTSSQETQTDFPELDIYLSALPFFQTDFSEDEGAQVGIPFGYFADATYQTSAVDLLSTSIQAGIPLSAIMDSELQTSILDLMDRSMQFSILMDDTEMQTSIRNVNVSAQVDILVPAEPVLPDCQESGCQTAITSLRSSRTQTSAPNIHKLCQTQFDDAATVALLRKWIQSCANRNQAIQTVSQTSADRQLTVSIQTDEIFEHLLQREPSICQDPQWWAMELVDRVVQTEDSFLAKLKQLNQLKQMHTQNLNVLWARKPQSGTNGTGSVTGQTGSTTEFRHRRSSSLRLPTAVQRGASCANLTNHREESTAELNELELGQREWKI